jgi:hypothetical protein
MFSGAKAIAAEPAPQSSAADLSDLALRNNVLADFLNREPRQARVCGETQDSAQATEQEPQSDQPMDAEPSAFANEGPMGKADAEAGRAPCLLRDKRQLGDAGALPEGSQTALA